MVMYYVSKKMEIAGCHRLTLSYKSKCENLHGHNWIVTVFCKAKEVNADGMVVDFKHIKEKIHSWLDHGNFNELLPFNPTLNGLQNRFQSVTKQKCRKAKVILLFM